MSALEGLFACLRSVMGATVARVGLAVAFEGGPCWSVFRRVGCGGGLPRDRHCNVIFLLRFWEGYIIATLLLTPLHFQRLVVHCLERGNKCDGGGSGSRRVLYAKLYLQTTVHYHHIRLRATLAYIPLFFIHY